MKLVTDPKILSKFDEDEIEEGQDYHSPVSERNSIDLIRDALHGGAKGLFEGGKALGNIFTLGNFEEAMPDWYKKHIYNNVQKGIEAIKPSNQSGFGNAVDKTTQLGTELLGGRALLRAVPEAQAGIRAIREAIPLFQRSGAAHERFMNDVEQQGATANINPAILDAIENFHQGTPWEAASAPNLQLARQGNIRAGHSLQSDLGKIGRAWMTEGERQLPAQRLQQDTISDLLRAIEEENGPELRRQLERTQLGFRTRKQLSNAVRSITGGAAKTAALVKAIGKVIGVH